MHCVICVGLDFGVFRFRYLSNPQSTAMSISSSFSSLLPNSPLPKTLISSLTTPPPFSLSRSISFQRLSIKPPQSLSSPFSPSPQPIDELPPKLQEIINLFQSVQQPKAKYEQLLFYGRNLPPLDDRYKTRDNKVHGCVSQVWLRAYLDSDNHVWFEADSDSVLTKGLAALLVQGLSGRPVADILRVSPDFITLLGLQQSLTPSRNNGFLNMLKLMQKKALLLAVGESGSGNGPPSSGNGDPPEVENWNSDSELSSDLGLENGNGGGVLGGRAERIKEKLGRELSPVELEVEDVSYQHAGHAGARGSDDGTHINLKIVSKEFEGKSKVKRHRMIYALLQDELQSGLHALSIVAKAPGELDER